MNNAPNISKGSILYILQTLIKGAKKRNKLSIYLEKRLKACKSSYEVYQLIWSLEYFKPDVLLKAVQERLDELEGFQDPKDQ